MATPAAYGFLAQFEAAGLAGVTPSDDGIFSSGNTSTAALFKAAPKDARPPSPVLDHATDGTALAARGLAPAGELSVAVSGGPPMVWRYDQQKSLWVG